MRTKVTTLIVLAGVACVVLLWFARPSRHPEAPVNPPVPEPEQTVPAQAESAATNSNPAQLSAKPAAITSRPSLQLLADLMQREGNLSNKDYFAEADKLYETLCSELATGKIDRADLRGLIEQLLASTSSRQRSMAWALAAAEGGLDNFKLLQSTYRTSQDEVTRTELLMRMGRCAARLDDNLGDWLQLLEAEQDSLMRRVIIGALARNGSPDAVAEIVARLQSSSTNENGNWAWGLSQVTNTASFPLLIQAASTSSDSAFATASLATIASSGQPGSARMLLDLYATNGLPNLRSAVLTALQRTRDEGNWTTLKDELNFGTSLDGRIAAASALFVGYGDYNPDAVRKMFTKLMSQSIPSALRAELERHLQTLNKQTVSTNVLGNPIPPNQAGP